MERIGQWLLGTVACALLVSMAEQLCPEGSVRKAVHFTGALLLLLAFFGPLSDAELPEELWDGGAYREAMARLEPQLDRTWEETISSGIAAQLEAYIEDKAEAMGSGVQAEIAMTYRGETPVPERVTLRGAYSGGLSDLIASELGIPKERQRWIENE